MDSFEVESYVRGYHVYNNEWTFTLGEELGCQREEDNASDCRDSTLDDQACQQSLNTLMQCFACHGVCQAYNTVMKDIRHAKF